MRSFRKNTAVAELLQREPTAGLPLFESNASSPSSRGGPRRGLTKKDQALLNAQRAIEVATPTRNLSHDILVYDPKALAEKQRIVFEEFSKYADATNEEIDKSLGWNHVNRVVARTYELRELNHLIPSQRRACKITGNVVQAWKVNPNIHQATIDTQANRLVP